MIHKSVLLNEVAEFFKGTDGVLIDATLGLGGHSERILEENPHIKIIGIDKDKISLEFAKNRLARFGARFCAIEGGFDEVLTRILDSRDSSESPHDSSDSRDFCDFFKDSPKIAGILADLGISSPQIDNLERGFSFHSPNLDMRMNLDSPLNAQIVVNSYKKEDLVRIFRDFGEVRESQKIAQAICEARKISRINSAKELCKIIESRAKPKGTIHPATLIFQAIRIEVNDELGALKRFLGKIAQIKGAKIAIISFHSLEDRMVKEAFRAWSANCVCDKDALKCTCGGNNARGEVLTKKPIIPSEAEIAHNKRARSAKMRCFRFYG